MQLKIRSVDHRNRRVAIGVHYVQQLAYAQEAELLGVSHFPPLERTVEDLMQGAANYLGAFANGLVVGTISVERTEAKSCIASLVVAPASQRQRIASGLLQNVIAAYGSNHLFVQTAARNGRALALYQRFGFSEVNRWCVGPEILELVELRRYADVGRLTQPTSI
jgi:ribosomal protein S18 acetylase RimI-like enzyme